MPIIASASKKLRHDRRRTEQTMEVRTKLRSIIKSFRVKPTKKSLDSVFGALDKAAKRNVIHKNKAARLKSRLSKLITKK